MGSETLPEITVCEHILLHHPKMQVEAPSCEGDTICEHDPETPPPSLGQSLVETGSSKVESFSVVGQIID